jgi:hypothetical protein
MPKLENPLDPEPVKAETKQQADFERARAAIEHFYRIRPNLEAFARVFTGNPKMTIVPTHGASATDGKRIWVRVGIELGDKYPHVRDLCDKRDAREQLICQACLVRENMLVPLFHEIAHIAYDSFEKMSDVDKESAVIEALEEAERFGIKGRRLDMVRQAMTERPPASYVEAASRISPFLHPILNALEDARVNAMTMDARPGMKVMFRSRSYRIFEHGIEQEDGSLMLWREAPENAQVIIGLFCLASGYNFTGWFTDDVENALRDPELVSLVAASMRTNKASEVYKLGFPILENLRRLGYCKVTGEPEDEPEPEPQPEGQSDEPRDEENPGEAGEPDHEDTGGDDDAEGGDEADSDDEAGTGAQGDGMGDTDTDESEPGGRPDPEREPDEQSDPHGSDGSDEQSDPDGSDEQDGADAGGSDEQSDPDGSDEQDGADAGDGSDDPSEAGISAGDDGDDEAEHGEEGGGDGDEGYADDDDFRQDDDYQGGEANGNSTSTESTFGDDDDRTDEPNLGDPNEVMRILATFGDHDDEHDHDHGDDEPEETTEPTEEEEAIERALVQTRDFDEPSDNVFENRVVENGKAFDAYTVERRPNLQLILPDERVVQRSLGKMRVAFSENKKGKHERNRRSGRVRGSALPRVALDDDRVFQQRKRPGKRDYFVLLGLDASYSTMSGNRMQMIKSAAFAQAELLSRIGVEFEVWAHSCDVTQQKNPDSTYGVFIETQLFPIKMVNERWDSAPKKKMADLRPVSANLDGHTMEFYRKRLDASRATDRVLMYYTDGDMPYENYTEELHILKRELRLCAQRNYEVVGVGVQTDSPKAHGLDTVRLDTLDDTHRVVEELHKRLTR